MSCSAEIDRINEVAMEHEIDVTFNGISGEKDVYFISKVTKSKSCDTIKFHYDMNF